MYSLSISPRFQAAAIFAPCSQCGIWLPVQQGQPPSCREEEELGQGAAAQSWQPHTAQHVQLGVLTQMDIHTARMASRRQQVLMDSQVLKIPLYRISIQVFSTTRHKSRAFFSNCIFILRLKLAVFHTGYLQSCSSLGKIFQRGKFSKDNSFRSSFYLVNKITCNEAISRYYQKSFQFTSKTLKL